MFAARFAFLLALAWTLAPAAENFNREIILAPQAGDAREDRDIARWQERARLPGAADDAFAGLAWAYVAKARRTLDAGYFTLAEKTADVIATDFGDAVETRFLHAYVFHQLHRFGDAERLARELVTRRGAPRDFALLSDILLDRGEVGPAADALQHFVDASPGAEAFCRVAQVRWFKGDLAGATVALEEAIRAGGPRDSERLAWLLARLSVFRLQAGAVDAALAAADAACAAAPAYPPALLAQGRAHAARCDWTSALPPLRAAAEITKLPEYEWWLADVLREQGDERAARDLEEKIVAHGAASDPRTLSLFLAARGRDTVRAVRLAREELRARGDVFSHDALASALCADGRLAEAQAAISCALAEHTRDARLFLHAGEIAVAADRAAEAAAFFRQAQTMPATLLPSERARLERHTTSSSRLSVLSHP